MPTPRPEARRPTARRPLGGWTILEALAQAQPTAAGESRIRGFPAGLEQLPGLAGGGHGLATLEQNGLGARLFGKSTRPIVVFDGAP